ncbi:hypothetical protein E4T39_05394 [Aureobasidium subglaciale]|nr:hypothetical protein E4T39_05394 [Aureobasidium subglaciale]
MASYDSDSDLEDENFTETNVLLGYATKDVADDTTSQLGGHATWLDEKTTPPGDLAKCKNCNGLLTLLLQLNGDLPDRFPGHERRLYLWACKRKACRRKDGSVRAFRAIRASAIAAEVEKPKQPKQETTKETPAPAAPKTNLGESLFGVKTAPTAATSSINPFATGGASSRPANPFSSAPASTPAAPTPAATETTPSLSDTFASKARISSPEPSSNTPAAPTGPREPWPQQSAFPPPYPSYYLDADYETLDVEKPEIPAQTRVDMDIDNVDGSSGAGADMDVKDAFESSMDKAFQRFADRMSQNPEQILRYEFAGQPLLYSKADAVGKLLGAHQDSSASNAKVKTSLGAKSGMPKCTNCGAERLFELQLTPYAIVELEAEELGLEGMEWGTIILGVCSKDCVQRGQKEGEVGYVEEWVGVQWEELTGKK